ncbi:MAG TPA: N-acetylmuramoyl-L-alanine amidase [Fastidiosipila sp.]|nr:N-acetylmuramoyl-L-alanine amidase [Fastidiosipila sp.]
MSARRAERMLAVIMAVAGVLLLLSLFGVLGSPWPHRPGRATTTSTTQSTAPKPDASDPVATDEEVENDATDPLVKTGELGALPLADNDPNALPAGGTALRVWPEDPVVPVLREITRESFIGRDYGPQALSGITVIIDAGHGGEDDKGHGAFGATEQQPIHEKDITLRAATMFGDRLRALGATIIYTRPQDTWQSLFYRVAFAADYVLLAYEEEASLAGFDVEPIRHLRPLMGDIMRINQASQDSGGRGMFGHIGTVPELRIIYDVQRQYDDVIFISLQTGFDQDESKRGTRSIYMSNQFIQEVNNSYAAGQSAATLPPNYTAYKTDDRYRLAGLLQAHMALTMPELKPGDEAVREEDMAVLRLTNLTSAVVELGYLSNAEDRALMTDDSSLGEMMQALTNAVFQYYCVR